jgi:hypothetical protein
MLFTADHEEVRRALQKFIAAEINRTICSRNSANSAFSA